MWLLGLHNSLFLLKSEKLIQVETIVETYTTNILKSLQYLELGESRLDLTVSANLFVRQTRSKFDLSSRQSTWDIFILHFCTSFRTTEVDYRLAAAIAPRAINHFEK